MIPMKLADYRAAIDLDKPFRPAAAPAADRGVLPHALLADLVADGTVARLGLRDVDIERAAGDPLLARRLLGILLTVRPPGNWVPEVLARVDALLSAEAADRPWVAAKDLPRLTETHPRTRYPAADRTALWQGDLTTLAADAVVNAANAALLGCFRPGHACVDNALHTAAGPRLREDCSRIMELQGHPEPTGTAKITRGYHLPARHVLHTVGPIVDGPPGPDDVQALAASYHSCLDLAAEAGARTVAFCSISTGVFGYPKLSAARVALEAVACWLDARPGALDLVVLDVYGLDDHAVYTSAVNEPHDW
jgi:O-acetyl-ADP-ribose deacetylase (regulator of RNase III)